MLLASCSAQAYDLPTPPGAPGPDASRAAVHITDAGTFEAIPGDLSLQGSELVTLRDMPACHFGQAVFRDLLSLNVSCTASGGSLSLLAQASPADIAQIGRATLRRAGFVVQTQGETITISGSGTTAAGVSGERTNGGDVEGIQGVEAYTVSRAEYGSITGQLPAGDLGRLHLSGIDPTEIGQLAEAFGIFALAYPVSDGAIVVSGSRELELIRSSFDTTSAVVSVPIPGVSQSLIDGVAHRHRVVIDVDQQRSLAAISGDPRSVGSASTELQSLVGDVQDLSLSVAFWRAETSQGAEFGFTPGIAVELDDFLIAFGASPRAPFSLAVDQLAAATRTQAEMQPAVALSPGASARFQSGQDIPFVSGITEEERQTVEYRSVGAILEANVNALPGGLYVLDLNMEISAVDGSGVLDNPVIGTRQVTTSVTLRRGQVVLLSGFSSAGSIQSRSRTLGLPSRRNSTSGEALSFIVALR